MNNCDFICADIEIDNADTGPNTITPFDYSGVDRYQASGGTYSVEISNVDLEDATGHALQLYADQSSGRRINDVYIHNSAVNFSGVTGILASEGGPLYTYKFCDGYRVNATNDTVDFANAHELFGPRNIRIEGNEFDNNNTGAFGFFTVRWLGMRNNTFRNNYIDPQVGNNAGGETGLGECADQAEITGNHFFGQNTSAATAAMELYGRNINVHDNADIASHGWEGMSLHSALNATVKNNTIYNNDWSSGLPNGITTGGIQLTTSFGGGCDGTPRDTQTVTITGNNISGQPYGIHFSDHGYLSRNP